MCLVRKERAARFARDEAIEGWSETDPQAGSTALSRFLLAR